MALLLGVVAVWELWAPIAYFVVPALGLGETPVPAEGRVASSVSVHTNPDDLMRERRLRGEYLGNDVVVIFRDHDGIARSVTGRTLIWPPERDDSVEVYYFASELTDAPLEATLDQPLETRALINLPGLLYGRAAIFGALALILMILYRGFGYFGRRTAGSFGGLAKPGLSVMQAMRGTPTSDATVRVIQNSGSDVTALRAAIHDSLNQAPVALVLKLATIACFFLAGFWALAAGFSLWTINDPGSGSFGDFFGSAIACVVFAFAGWYLRKVAARMSTPNDKTR